MLALLTTQQLDNLSFPKKLHAWFHLRGSSTAKGDSFISAWGAEVGKVKRLAALK
jgi:hypothetical protein